jgi:WS/DGAT/MGAT family acyltransferase
MADALAERASAPLDAVRVAFDALSHPEKAAEQLGRAAYGFGAMLRAGLQGAPPSPYNVPIGPHRRFAWAETDLARLKAVKAAHGGTVNDAVLTIVAGALRAHLFRRGRDPERIELKAMVPISVRAEAERGALGNRVAAMYAPLPVGIPEPLERFRFVRAAMAGLKDSGQAVGAEAITRLAGVAAPTVLDQAARLQTRQRFFNLTVTNVPGPQFPLYVLGRRLEAFYPQVPLVLNTALGIAVMSYDGRVFFGLLGDYDGMADLDAFAADVDTAIEDLGDGGPGGRVAVTPAQRAGSRAL